MGGDQGGEPDHMYAFERKDKTLLQLREHGRITVAREARRLGVSLATLRRDLEDLERQGLIQKVRVGAVLAEATRFETHFDVRMKTGVAAKQHIARRAGIVGRSHCRTPPYPPRPFKGQQTGQGAPVGDLAQHPLQPFPRLLDMQHGLLAETPQIRDGMLELPDRPGLGIVIDEDRLKHVRLDH